MAQASYFGLEELVEQLEELGKAMKRKVEVAEDIEFFGREKLIGEISDVAKKVEECGQLISKKIDSSKDELAYIGTSLEELWRIKCELKAGLISNLTSH